MFFMQKMSSKCSLRFEAEKRKNLAAINLITLSNPGQNITVSFLR